MVNWDYLAWEWRQTVELFCVSPREPTAVLLLGMYPFFIVLGLTLLHRFQLSASERAGKASASVYLRRRLYWEQRAALITFLLWFCAALVPVFKA